MLYAVFIATDHWEEIPSQDLIGEKEVIRFVSHHLMKRTVQVIMYQFSADNTIKNIIPRKSEYKIKYLSSLEYLVHILFLLIIIFSTILIIAITFIAIKIVKIAEELWLKT